MGRALRGAKGARLGGGEAGRWRGWGGWKRGGRGGAGAGGRDATAWLGRGWPRPLTGVQVVAQQKQHPDGEQEQPEALVGPHLQQRMARLRPQAS